MGEHWTGMAERSGSVPSCAACIARGLHRPYRFDELSEAARTRAVDRRIELAFGDSFEWAAEDAIAGKGFGRPGERASEIRIQYDFSCCQGSGLNLYGEFDVVELLRFAGCRPGDAVAPLIGAADGEPWKVAPNRRYSYCLWDGSMAEDLYSHIRNAAWWDDLIVESESGEAFSEDYPVKELRGGPLPRSAPDDELMELCVRVVDAVADLASELYQLGSDMLDDFCDPASYEGELFGPDGSSLGCGDGIG